MSCPVVPFTQRACRMYTRVHLPPGFRIQVVAQSRLTHQRLCFRLKEPDLYFCCRCLGSRLTLCDPMDSSGISQARTLEWVAMPSSGLIPLDPAMEPTSLNISYFGRQEAPYYSPLTYSCDFSQLLITLVEVSPSCFLTKLFPFIMKPGSFWYCGCILPFSSHSCFHPHFMRNRNGTFCDLVSFLCLNFPSTPIWCKWECGWTSRFAQVTYSQWASKQASEWGLTPQPCSALHQASRAPSPQGPSGEWLKPAERAGGQTWGSATPQCQVPQEVSLWLFTLSIVTSASQGALEVKNLPANAGDTRDVDGFDSWVRKIPWKRAWQLTLVFLSGKSHGQRSLVDNSPQGCKESDTTEQPSAHAHTHTHTHTHTHRVTSNPFTSPG